jgi:hypothetical protein
MFTRGFIRDFDDDLMLKTGIYNSSLFGGPYKHYMGVAGSCTKIYNCALFYPDYYFLLLK